MAPPGFWLLGILLCLSYAPSMAAYDKGTPAHLRRCLNASIQLRKEASESLNQFRKEFNSCTMKDVHIHNPPKNEDKIISACIPGQSKPGASGENHSVNQTLCMETMHAILLDNIKDSKIVDHPKLRDATNNMLQALKISDMTIEGTSEKPASFSSQMQHCKSLLIFKELTETIVRNLSYLNSPEQHPKC